MPKKKGLPKWNENVLCTVTRITPFAAWCTLDEYENEDGSSIEGMIHISQVAGRWVKDIRKYVKQSKQYIAKIIRIDYEKGHINLSLKRVSKVDKREKMDTYRRDKRVSGMLNQVAKRMNEPIENVDKEITQKLEKIYDDIFAAFEEASENPDVLKEAGVEKKWADAAMEVIQQNFQTKERRIKAEVEMSTAAPDGVKKLKNILANLEKKVDGVKVKYISAPKYIIEMRSENPKESVKQMKEALDEAVSEIEAAGGKGSYEFVK